MYRKKLVFIVALFLIVTGCTKVTDDLDSIVDATMVSNGDYVNTVSTGYELYIPTGVKQVTDSQYNQKIMIRDRYVYLYVDTVSYYYKNTLNYKSKGDYNYYFKEFKIDNNGGYIGIDKVEEDLFFCEIVYNYSKIEFYSNKRDLPVILANSLIIQKSIKYNDSLINLELGNVASDGREIKYELDSPKDAKSTFDDYLQEFVPDVVDEVVLPDDD